MVGEDTSAWSGRAADEAFPFGESRVGGQGDRALSVTSGDRAETGEVSHLQILQKELQLVRPIVYA